jgi:hypothetical protein
MWKSRTSINFHMMLRMQYEKGDTELTINASLEQDEAFINLVSINCIIFYNMFQLSEANFAEIYCIYI